MTRRLALVLAVAIGTALAAPVSRAGGVAARGPVAGPSILSYEDLVELYERPTPGPALARRMDAVLTTPFVSNAATARGVVPIKPSSPALGRFLRVVEWNVERGLELDEIKLALTDPQRLLREGDERAAHLAVDKGERARLRTPEETALVVEQARALVLADVIVLNEVDRGMKRTGYRDVVAELAETLDMNYAYGVEFLEVDPVALGIEPFEALPADERAELRRDVSVDPARYEGMHGSAILSRYRLDNVRLIPFETKGYDWYARERKNISPLEQGRRLASDRILLETVTREIRRGGRMMLVADISDPEIPTGTATVVATHLEDKTRPKYRVKQLQEVLAHIAGSEHPVIVAGDMNTNGSNVAPISVRREIKKRVTSADFWVKHGIFLATGVGFLGSLLISGANTYRSLNDPTVKNIRFVAENDERRFFDTLEAFRMDGGGAFDLRGDRARSFGEHSRTLANASERGTKGFVPTFRVERNIAKTGQFKLDWIFVASTFLTDPDARSQPYRFAPHFGRTLEALNESVPDRLSDHNPILVDLPFAEPAIPR